MSDIFMRATKSKLRFKVANGSISTEDLWSLELSQLDEMAKCMRKKLRESDESFIGEVAKDVNLELGFEVVKSVIESKITDRDSSAKEREKSIRKQVLLGLIAEKSLESTKNKSLEELQKELESLG